MIVKVFEIANFRTHRDIGIFSTVLATLTLNFIEMSNIETIALMIVVGSIASLAPDLDLRTSKPFQFFKTFIYLFIPLILVYKVSLHQIAFFNNFNAPFEALAIAIAIITLLNYIFLNLLSSNMIHRGLVHSIPFALITAIIVYEIALSTPYSINALYVGIIWFTGFITHLLLDEIYSVNLMNSKIKKSFGSALSLIKFENLCASFLMYLFLGFYIYSIKDYSYVSRFI